jgi:hypothetical protein
VHLLLDEQLPRVAARALQEIRLRCEAVGDAGCPTLGADDDTIVRWCLHHGAILVTADRSRKRKEMRAALKRHGVPVVHLRRPTRAVPLLRGLLNAWDSIEEHAANAKKAGVQMMLTMEPGSGSVSKVRAKRP